MSTLSYPRGPPEVMKGGANIIRLNSLLYIYKGVIPKQMARIKYTVAQWRS